MIKIMRAVAAVMLLATGAQAATVDGLFALGGGLVDNPQAGQTYYFAITLDNADLEPLPNGLTQGAVVGSRLYMTISGQGKSVSTSGQVEGPGLTYWYQWIWEANGLTDFQFQNGTLLRYLNGKTTGTVVTTDTMGPFVGTSFVTQKIDPLDANLRLAAINPTPVPIGGTLPLMLSALGLGALVMRRRAKAALA